jgi:hypothetical protein
MTRRLRRSLAALAILVVSGGVGYVWLTREVVYLAASSNTKRIVAAVRWNTTVFGMVDAHLVIRDFYGTTLYRTRL